MHARELVELAAVVAAHGPVLIRQSQRITASSIEQYWAASKCRLDRWGRALKQLGSQTTPTAPACVGEASAVCSLLEEILAGEVLTRVWTAVACAFDRIHETDQVESVARSVLIGHLEARHRVLTLLVRGPGVDAEEAVKLNRLRRRTERWTDMLLGYLMGVYDVQEFAIDPQRAKDFAEDLSYQSQLPGGRHAWSLVQASLQAAFGQGLSPTSPNADLNRQIATSILSCFHPEVFDETGLPRSAWLARITYTANDAAGMIDALLQAEAPAASPFLQRRSEQLRRLGGRD